MLYPFQMGKTDGYCFTARSITGALLDGNTAEFVSWRFSMLGVFDWRNAAIAAALCTSGDTIVEIGAHVGTETLFFSGVVGGSGHVYAVEPVPSNARALKRTLERNAIRNVTLLECAVGESIGAVRFASPVSSNTGMGHMDHDGDLEVTCETLDSLEASIGRAAVIYADVEGAELSILRGGRGYLSRHRPALVLEVVPRWLERAGIDANAIRHEIKSLSYAAYELGRFGLREIADSWRGENWLCLPNERRADAKAVRRALARCSALPADFCFKIEER